MGTECGTRRGAGVGRCCVRVCERSAMHAQRPSPDFSYKRCRRMQGKADGPPSQDGSKTFHPPHTKEQAMAAEEREERDLNRDPITEEPGAHPIGTGIGATGGAVAGAA